MKHRLLTTLAASLAVLVMVTALLAAIPKGLAFYAHAEDSEVTLSNVALGKDVYASSSFLPPEGYFGVGQVNDGQWEIYNPEAGITTIGWSTNPHDLLAEDSPVDLTIKLGKTYALHEIIMCPAPYWEGTSFPREFEMQVSEDGFTWKTVAVEQNEGYAAASNEEITPFSYSLDTPVTAAYFRVHITRHSTGTDAGTGGYLSGFGEIQLMGVEAYSMALPRTSIELYVGENDQLIPTFTGVDGTPALTYKSLDESVVTVAADGTLTAKKLGSTVVEVTDTDHDKTVTCQVLVVEAKRNFHDNIVLAIFWPPTLSYVNDEQYKLMADAGINLVLGAGDGNLLDSFVQKRMLELCDKYGMGMIVQEGYHYVSVYNNPGPETAGAYYRDYKNMAALDGYYVIDEPMNPNVWFNFYRAVKEADPTAYMHLNFYPDSVYASEKIYRAQLHDWCAITAAAGYPADYLTFDRYPFGMNGDMDRLGFFANLRSVYEVGLKNNIATGMYIQSVGNGISYETPSDAMIRYEMYACLAFGYKQLSYFTWFTPTGRSEVFENGVISPDGVPNAHYEGIKVLNHEVLAIGQTLAKCDALGVYFTGMSTYGQPEVPEDFFVQANANSSAIVSHLRHTETGRNYLMVVNNNYEKEQTVTLTFDESIQSLFEVSRENGALKSLAMDGQKLKLTLAAGDGMLIALPENIDFYEAPSQPEDPSTNLAADANIIASSSVGELGYYVAFLNDGTRFSDGKSSGINGWKSNVDDAPFVQIDFGYIAEFNRLDLYPDGKDLKYATNFPKEFKISVSDDGKNFTEIKTVGETTFVNQDGISIDIGEQKARYLRIDVTEFGKTKTAVGFAELEVYNDDGSVARPTGAGEIVETQPVETQPVETQPQESDPIETDPIETNSDESDPMETVPVETDPIETEPVESDTSAIETSAASEAQGIDKEKGCSSSVGMSALLILLVGGAGCLALRKKRED